MLALELDRLKDGIARWRLTRRSVATYTARDRCRTKRTNAREHTPT
ncbi:hypothetical protein [Halobaculum halobium]